MFALPQDAFNISDGIDGSATSYTVQYSDSVYGYKCGSATIPASGCQGSICTHVFDVSSSSCPSSADVNITVSATNILGEGLSSVPMSIGIFNLHSILTHILINGHTVAFNYLVSVEVDLYSSTVTCKFLNQHEVNMKSCIIEYGSSKSCHNLPFSSKKNETVFSTISIDLDTHAGFFDERMYCYIITANNGTHTTKIHGQFNSGMHA